MNLNDLKQTIPSIKLYVSSRLADQSAVDYILYGAEEEGIPVDVEKQQEDDVLKLAHKASVDSTLGTGIGVSASKAAVHFGKLPIHRPVFEISLSEGETVLRLVGSNAARLVKRLPLRMKESDN